jgi:hypothetical protein
MPTITEEYKIDTRAAMAIILDANRIEFRADSIEMTSEDNNSKDVLTKYRKLEHLNAPYWTRTEIFDFYTARFKIFVPRGPRLSPHPNLNNKRSIQPD